MNPSWWWPLYFVLLKLLKQTCFVVSGSGPDVPPDLFNNIAHCTLSEHEHSNYVKSLLDTGTGDLMLSSTDWMRVDDENARPSYFPWVVAVIVPDEGYRCSGVLIDEKLVLTARQCVVQTQVSCNKHIQTMYSTAVVKAWKVVVGYKSFNETNSEHQYKDTTESDQNGQVIGVEAVVVHPSQRYDLAMIKLKDSVKYSEYAKPICLNGDMSQVDIFNEPCLGYAVAGYGPSPHYLAAFGITNTLGFDGNIGCERNFGWTGSPVMGVFNEHWFLFGLWQTFTITNMLPDLPTNFSWPIAMTAAYNWDIIKWIRSKAERCQRLPQCGNTDQGSGSTGPYYFNGNPCQNGGTCTESEGKFICNCASSYTGQACSIALLSCQEQEGSCQNGGTCVSQSDALVCMCTPEYEGSRCEFKKEKTEPCSTKPCENGATCVTEGESYTCTCIKGFTGVNCKIAINECDSTPCQHHGTCEDKENGYTCKCQPGYKGNHCETDINECEPNPCIATNTKDCENKVNAYVCHCKGGYTGDRCEKDINECSNNPCKHGATCNNEINKFSCTCHPGYTGKLCETDIDECRPNPCIHNGTCEDQVNGYKCKCPEPQQNYEEPNCDFKCKRDYFEESQFADNDCGGEESEVNGPVEMSEGDPDEYLDRCTDLCIAEKACVAYTYREDRAIRVGTCQLRNEVKQKEYDAHRRQLCYYLKPDNITCKANVVLDQHYAPKYEYNKD